MTSRRCPQQLFGNFQYEIYGLGLGGQTPKLPVAVGELEASAREVMTPQAFGYVAGGAGSELTVKANRDAFERWQIVPRMLRDVSDERPRHDDPRHPLAGSGAARAGRSAVDRPPRG